MQFGSEFARALGIARGRAMLDPQVAAFAPAQLLQSLQESRIAGLSLEIVLGEVREHADAPYALALLRARRERPRRRTVQVIRWIFCDASCDAVTVGEASQPSQHRRARGFWADAPGPTPERKYP